MGSLKLPHASGNSMSIAAPATNPASDLELKLPATIGTANQVVANSSTPGTLAFANLPFNEFDHWHLTDDVESEQILSSNLVRTNVTGSASQIGTGMSESSGIFTFPFTGKYLVIANAQWTIHDSDSVGLDTQVTVDNASYSVIAKSLEGLNDSSGGNRSASGTSFAFIDVTDVSQVKVRFKAASLSTGTKLIGNATSAYTSFIFARLGDT